MAQTWSLTVSRASTLMFGSYDMIGIVASAAQ